MVSGRCADGPVDEPLIYARGSDYNDASYLRSVLSDCDSAAMVHGSVNASAMDSSLGLAFADIKR